MAQGWKRRISRAIKYYGTPQNVKNVVKSGTALYKTAQRVQKTARRVYKKQYAKKHGAYRTRIRQNPGDAGISQSATIYVQNKSPRLGNLKVPNATNTFEEARSFSFASSTGTVPGTNQLNRQKVFELLAFGKGTQIASLYASTLGATNPEYVVLMNSTYAGQQVGKLLYKGVKGHFEFSNCEQSNLIGTIYMCVARTNNSASYVDPATAWEQGVDETAGFTRGTTNVANFMPDSEPTGVYFRDRWRIVAKKKFSIAAGITQRHYFSHVVNKVIDVSTWTNHESMKDVTLSFLVKMRGVPVDFDAVQTHGPATLIGYSPSKIVGVSTFKYSYKLCNLENPKVTYQNNALSGTAPTAVWELNDEDGKPVNVFAATNAA